jgi:predicted Zn-dependent protease
MADRPVEAVDVLEPLVAAAADTVAFDWVQALVSAAAAAGQPGRAEAGIAQLLRNRPSDPAAWRLASQLAQLGDDLPLAAVRSQVAAWLDDPDQAERRRLAELQAAAGAPRLAARTYQRLWDGGRGDRDLVWPLAVTWLQAHEPDSARAVLESALAAEPSARLLMLLGDLEYGVERWDAAAAAYARAVELEPGHGRAWLMMGASAVAAGKADEAVAPLRRAADDPAVGDEARRLLAQLERPAG